MKRENRVKFYSKFDLSIGHELNKATKVLNNQDIENHIEDINDIIELYNIQLYFDNGLYLDGWSEETKNKYIDVVSTYKGIIGKWLNNINDDNFTTILEDINREYMEDLFSLISRYKVFNNISSKTMHVCLEDNKISIRTILENENISNHYEDIILDYAEEHTDFAALLIDYYLRKHDDNVKLYFPKSLDKEKCEKYIDRYVDSDIDNTNLLQLLTYSKGTNRFTITPELSLKAQKKIDEFIAKHKDDFKYIGYGIRVEFIDKFNVYIERNNANTLVYQYDKKWIENHLDYKEILSSFTNLFHFFDNYGNFTFVVEKSSNSILLPIFLLNGKRDYPKGQEFEATRKTSYMQMDGYFHILNDKDINFENVIKWFFEEHIKNDYGIDMFVFRCESKEADYTQKCKNMCSEIESIVKQFSLYCENGSIDKELFVYIKDQKRIDNVPSILPNKYFYIKNEDCGKILFLLFNFGSPLAYFDKEKFSYGNTFYEKLNNYVINKNDLLNYQVSEIEFLIKYKIIQVDKENNIIPDKYRLSLLKVLYDNKVISTYSLLSGAKLSTEYYRILCDLNNQNLIKSEQTLLSIPEQHYYNYMLNDLEYDNGPSIRNKYSHGSPYIEEVESKCDYYELLKIMILIMYKIDNELSIQFARNNESIKNSQ